MPAWCHHAWCLRRTSAFKHQNLVLTRIRLKARLAHHEDLLLFSALVQMTGQIHKILHDVPFVKGHRALEQFLQVFHLWTGKSFFWKIK
jgi:hypothetical protein